MVGGTLKNMRGAGPWRQYCTLVKCAMENQAPAAVAARVPTFLPLPHRSIPDPAGQDLDFITVAHSHVVHEEWPRLDAMAAGLTPFRTSHIILKVKRDPVVSLEFFRWAARHSPSPVTLDIYSMILHILTKAKRFRAAETLLKETVISEALKVGTDLFDSLLCSYRLCDSSSHVFDCLFKTYSNMKKFRATTETFHRMREYGFFPTVRSCNAYMSALLKHNRTDIILSFYREMRRCRISANVFTLNIVMLALCNSGKLDRAMDMFEEMETLGIHPTVSTYNTLIAGYCRSGLMSSAVKLKDSMKDRGLHPNGVTYNILIHGFCKEGKMQDANKLFKRMKASNLVPSASTYTIIISGYNLVGDSETSSALFEEMRASGVKPDIFTYNAQIVGLCDKGKTKKAAYLVKEMDERKITPNASTFFALISAQCKRQNSERAYQVYEVMKKYGCSPNVGLYNMLISTFCKNGDFEGAVQVMRDMLDALLNPDDSLLVEVFEGLFRCGKTGLASKFASEYSHRKVISDCYSKCQHPPIINWINEATAG